ncbi:TetR/AcrR family transcriptional regulator [Paenibacillus pasadenensis]|uniref:TetR/AcrR family transcriptional regulator n=1 Tax=Paenibacillus pasadenensis TaxID=217090 RepID=UPI001FD2C56A|nr:TetR/AcrR family transcriptional regulator [Paenibacillus pasadenensis]
MAGKVDPRVARSKTALKQALLRLLEGKEFESVTITEIVQTSGYNRGTFYKHYDNKEALLEDILNDLIEGLLEAFRYPYEQTEVFRVHQLPPGSVKIFDHFMEHAPTYGILTRSQVMPALREKMFRALRDISSRELVPELDGIDAELLADYSIHGLLGILFHWIESGFARSPAYMQEQLVKIIRFRPDELQTRPPT